MEVKPLDEFCETCGAKEGKPCWFSNGHFHDARWRRAAETRECLEEEARERRADGERTYQPHGRF